MKWMDVFSFSTENFIGMWQKVKKKKNEEVKKFSPNINNNKNNINWKKERNEFCKSECKRKSYETLAESEGVLKVLQVFMPSIEWQQKCWLTKCGTDVHIYCIQSVCFCFQMIFKVVTVVKWSCFCQIVNINTETFAVRGETRQEKEYRHTWAFTIIGWKLWNIYLPSNSIRGILFHRIP